MEVLNKDLEIAHLEEGATLEMELKARNGRGYISADGNKALYQGSSQGIGTVYTDSIYTPIDRISYNGGTDSCRPGCEIRPPDF